MSSHPSLQGPLAPVYDERYDTDLKITGELPRALNGMFLRNGPNPQFEPKGAYHPFDGDGMLHAVYMNDGKASYRNRWIESAGLMAERKRGHACYGSLAEMSEIPADVMEEAGFMKNTANTATVQHGGHLFALMEGCPPTRISHELETLGEHNFDGKLQGAFTAHPKIDSKTGEMVFFGYSPFPPYVQYYVADASGKIINHQVIDIPNPILMHDFVVSENYTIFVDSPAVFDIDGALSGEPGVRWLPEQGTRMGIIPRMGTAEQLRWFDIPTCNIVHFFNAWDDGNKIEIHAPTFAEMPGGLQFDNPTQTEEPFPHRWLVDLEKGTVKYEKIDDMSGEFPRINDSYAGQRSRFMYNALARDWAFDFDFNGVIKYDIDKGTSKSFRYGDTEVSGEHTFVADPNGEAEDDGWLMSMIIDKASEESNLSIIDARDVEAGPIARVLMPRRVPIGFHAAWFPG